MQTAVTLPRTSLASLFEVIFSEPVTVCTSDSDYGQQTTIFTSPPAALEYLEGRSYVGYALHYPDSGGYVEDRLVKLDPAKCQGHTFRHCVGGWGLIHVQLKKQHDLFECRVAVNTSKRAAAWAGTHPELKDPALWRWPAVERHARKLIRHLKGAAQQDAARDKER